VSAEGLPFSFFEENRAAYVGSFTAQFDQVKDAPGDDHVHRQTGFDATGAAELAFFNFAAAFQRAMVDLDSPPAGIPRKSFDRLRAVGHLTCGEQHPADGLDTFCNLDFLSQHGPHGQRF